MAGRGTLPGGIQTIALQLLENRSSETGAETLVTNALINEFNRRRRGSVASTGQADAILRGTIDSITRDTIARQGSNAAAERRVRATVALQLTDKNGKILWERSGMQAQQAYLVDQESEQATEYNRRQAISELSQRIAEIVYGSMTDNF